MLAKSLPVQINSDSSEINPFILNNQIYYSSNREGGCGGFDIYFDKLCGNVVLLGIVFDKQNKLPLNGVVRIYDNSTKLIKEINIEDNGNFSTELLPNSQYFIEYYNSCVPLYTPRKLIQTPCNEESITQLNLPIELKLDGYNYEFGGVDIPFFVSGYYKPNTHNELQNLRLLFENNLIGIADSTKYIEYPDKKYDDYSIIVQNSLNTLTQTILDIIKNSKTNCNIDLYKNIKIKIIGYADERGFSDFARYSGDEIVDSKIDRKVLSGMKMDNELLGLLRAYNTFKYLENELNKDPLFKENESKVKWDISSGGISTTENEQIRKRKVEIIISTE
jgi:ABC-type antimicrobial peptide transport system permease subunit